MDDCCIYKACAIERLRERQAATLRVVLMLNVAMFVVELVFGLLAGSVALLADSLDMLGDALVYGFSLYVVARGPVWKARAAVAKAAVMGLFGAFVFGQLAYKLVYPQLPMIEIMGGVGVLALAANGRLLCPPLEPPRRGYQHAVGLAVLAKRSDRKRLGVAGCVGRVDDAVALAGHRSRCADLRRVPSFGVSCGSRSACGAVESTHTHGALTARAP